MIRHRLAVVLHEHEAEIILFDADPSIRLDKKREPGNIARHQS